MYLGTAPWPQSVIFMSNTVIEGFSLVLLWSHGRFSYANIVYVCVTQPISLGSPDCKRVLFYLWCVVYTAQLHKEVDTDRATKSHTHAKNYWQWAYRLFNSVECSVAAATTWDSFQWIRQR